MSRFSRITTLVCSIALAMTFVPAAAQEEGAFPPPEDLAGLQTAVVRTHVLDFSAIEPTGPGTPEAEYRDALFLSGLIFEFDTSEHAATAYDQFIDHGVDNLLLGFGMEAPEITEVDLEDIGERAHAFSAFNATESTEGYARYSVMHQDAYVFIGMIITESEAASLDADTLLMHFASVAAEGYTGVGEVVAEGAGSTGGLWDAFPAADDALWTGLVADDDEVLFPEPAA